MTLDSCCSRRDVPIVAAAMAGADWARASAAWRSRRMLAEAASGRRRTRWRSGRRITGRG